MACKTALLLALLIAASQAAPQGQVQNTAAQETDSSTAATGANPDTSSSASGGSNSSGSGPQAGSGSSGDTGSSTASPAPVVIFPHISNLLPSFNFTGTPASASSGVQNPIAAIISIIPNAINAERERVSSAVQNLVSQQVDAATDSIGAAAQTGGQLVSNGIKAIASWPVFWANLLG